MSFRKSNRILEVYIEPDDAHTPEEPGCHTQESQPEKLTSFEIDSPEWAAAALRRVHTVKHVADMGEYTNHDGKKMWVIKVIYDASRMTSIEKLKDMIKGALQSSGVNGYHL
jgi:hypothetical protein